jgi:F-type H+-transporting ATPase subunit c
MDVAAAKALGAGIAVIALAGVGIGIGNIFSALVTSVARNPSAADRVPHPVHLIRSSCALGSS